MVNVLQAARRSINKRLRDDEGFFRGGRFTPEREISEFARRAGPVIAEKAWQPLANLQRATQRAENAPRIEIKRWQPQSLPGKFAKGTIESYSNIRRNVVVSSARLGNLIGEIARGDQDLFTRSTAIRALSGIAPLVESVVDVWGLGMGGVAEQGLKQTAEQGLKQTIKRGLLHGAKEGILPGTIGGASYEIGKDARQINVRRAVESGLIGGTIGMLLGGAIEGSTAAAGQLRNKVIRAVRRNLPGADEATVIKETNKFIRNELGQFMGIRKQITTRRVPIKRGGKIVDSFDIKETGGKERFYQDLRKDLGLPPDGNYQVGKIDLGAVIGRKEGAQGGLPGRSRLRTRPERLAKLKTQVTRERQLNKAAADRARSIREMFTSGQIKDINRVKTVSRGRAFRGGDIETLKAGKNGELVEKVVESVREKRPDIVSDEEALAFALRLPTKAETVVHRPANAEQLKKLLERQAEDQKNWEREFGKVVSEIGGRKESDRLLFEGTMTPKQYDNLQNKRLKSRQAFNKRMVNESLKNEGGFRAYRGGKTPATRGLPARALLKTAKDKSPFAFQRETVKRNIEDVFGKKSAMNEFVVGNLTKNELNATQQRNSIRKQITRISNKYQIRRGSKADKAAADFIEGNIGKKQLKSQFGAKAKGIIKLAEEGRKTYKTLLEQINAEITQYGYEPIKERQNYVTHTKQILGFGDKVGSILNLKQGELPRAMAAINTETKPGRKFFGFSLQRKGGATHEGLLVSLDKYLDSATRQIHHTSDIQRGRAVLDLLQRSGETNKTMSNFTSYFGQYVDSIAGKQNIIDRPFEKVLGRKILRIGDWARKRTGANMVGGNVSSALTNFMPFTQSLATTSKPASARGLIEATTNVSKQPGLIDGVESSFLTRRFPIERMGKTVWSSIKDAAGFLFQAVDKFTSTSIVAGKYYEGISKGMSKLDSMKAADDFAARVMADRSFGQSPLIFNSRVLGTLTQFQLEINNQLSFLFKDIPKNMDFNKAEAASALMQFTLYSYLLNNFYEKVTGRRPQLDPIYMAMTARGLTPEGEDQDFAGKARAIAEQVGQGLPLPSSGRLPVQAALPDVGRLIKGETDLISEVKKPLFYLAPPFGGGQIKKTLEGTLAGQRGYSETRTGKARFPVKPSVKTSLFGQWSTPEARDYFAKRQRPLGKTQTEYLKSLPREEKQGFFKTIQVKRKKDREKNERAKLLKAGADSFSTDKGIEYYDKKSGQVRTLNYGKIESLPTSTRAQRVKKESEIFSFVKRVMAADIPQEKKNELIKSVGISSRDAEYYSVASGPTREKTAIVYDLLDGVSSRQEMLQILVMGRREVNGKKLVTSGVINDLYDEGIITSAEKKWLKSIKQNKLGKLTRGRAKGTGRKPSKPTFRKITAPSVPRIKLPASKPFSTPKKTKIKVNIKRTIPRVRLRTSK